MSTGEPNLSAFVSKNEDPIGQQIRLAGGSPTEGYGPWRTIVGIVGDVKQHGLDQDTPQQIFLPVVQQTRTTVFAVARTRGTVSSSSIETAIRDLDRSVPVFNDRTVEQVMREAGSRRRVAAIVLSVFAGAAVLLAAIGLYGVIAQSVSERRQEIGVRMALGATHDQILRLFLRHGLIVVAIGIGAGIAAAVAAGRSLASLVFGVTVTDPVTLGTVAALLTAVTLARVLHPGAVRHTPRSHDGPAIGVSRKARHPCDQADVLGQRSTSTRRIMGLAGGVIGVRAFAGGGSRNQQRQHRDEGTGRHPDERKDRRRRSLDDNDLDGSLNDEVQKRADGQIVMPPSSKRCAIGNEITTARSSAARATGHAMVRNMNRWTATNGIIDNAAARQNARPRRR